MEKVQEKEDETPVHITLYPSLSSLTSKQVVIYMDPKNQNRKKEKKKAKMDWPVNVSSTQFLTEPAEDDLLLVHFALP